MTQGMKMADETSGAAPTSRLPAYWRPFTYGLIALYALVGLIEGLLSTGLPDWPRLLVDLALFHVLGPLGILWFIEIFSETLCDKIGPLPNSSAEVSGPLPDAFLALKRRWMIFAYGFMFFAIGIAVYPFMVDRIPEPAEKEQYALYVQRSMDSPISVLRGCVLGDPSSAGALACRDEDGTGRPRLSWIIQAGGQVVPLGQGIPEIGTIVQTSLQQLMTALDALVTAAATDTIPEPLRSQVTTEVEKLSLLDAELTNKLKEQSSQAKVYLDEATAIGQLTEALTRQTRTLADSVSAQIGSGTSEQLAAPVEAVTTLADTLVREVRAYQERAASLAALGASDDGGFTVTGGLNIPLYLVILSLIGGAISLTRRIPEYQKRSERSYTPVGEAHALTPAMLREYLVFQIVQFVSAPLIAVVAYYVLQPSSTAAAVSLAFASGFASETVLLWVRAVVEKLEPVRPLGLGSGSVVGLVTDETRKPLARVIATVVGAPALTAETKEDGVFILNGVPAGDWAVQVADQTDGKRQRLVRVTVAADQASYLQLPLPPRPPANA